MTGNNIYNTYKPNAPLKILPISNRLVVGIGSSLTQHNSDDAYSDNERRARGPITWLRALTNQSFDFINAGVSGQTTVEMNARLNTDVIDKNPAVVIVQAGTNELADGYLPVIEARQEMYDRLIGAGIYVVILSILHRDISASGISTTQQKAAYAVNHWAKSYADSNPNCTYVDWSKYWIDPTSTDGDPVTGYSNDGTHFNAKGAYYLAQALLPVFNNLFPPRDVLHYAPFTLGASDIATSPYGAISVNPTMQGTGGDVSDVDVTGAVPTSYSVDRGSGNAGEGSVAASVGTYTTLGSHRYTELTFTPHATVSPDWYFTTATSNITPPATGWYELVARIEVDAWDGWAGHQLELMHLPADGSGNKYYTDMDTTNATEFPNVSWQGVLRTPRIYIGDTADRIRMRVRVETKAGASGTGKLRVSNFNILRVPE